MPALKPLSPVPLVECAPFKIICTEAGRSTDGLVGMVQWVNGAAQWMKRVRFGATEDQDTFIAEAMSGTDLTRDAILQALTSLANAIEAMLRSNPADPRPKDDRPDPQRVALVKAIGIAPALAQEIQTHDHFAQDIGERLYRYHHGVYVSDGVSYVKRQVKRLLDDWKMTDQWSRGVADETAEYLRVDAPFLWNEPTRHVLNLQNGLLDLETRELDDHSPTHLSTCQLPVSYHSGATCPAIETFVGQVFPADSVKQAWEIVATLMSPTRNWQRAVLLHGTGGNGKGVFLRLLVSFLGRSNLTSLSLQKLEMDRFAVARLYGKMANICPDLPSTHLEETAIFKALTGGDEVTGEYKYKDSFDFRPYARLVFSANHYPRSSDDSEGFFDRWHVIPFEQSFRGTTAEVPMDTLVESLTTEAELSGLLNKALSVFALVTKRGISMSDSTQRAFEEFRKATDPLSVWLEKSAQILPEAHVAKDALLQAYNKSCDTSGRARISAHAMTKAVKRWRPSIMEQQRPIGGKTTWCWMGIGLSAPDPEAKERAA